MTPRAYYNENDPYCAQWLRNLIAQDLIAPGDVDDRSVLDVRPKDLAGYAQCHFFAGIGGWSRALRLAGAPDHRPLWTGSCPCQPFSVAGKRGGFADERHLWPYWFHLVEQCRPPVLFGEQVASASAWIELVRGDLEAVGYAVAAIPMEAASVLPRQFRDRYWFVACDDEQCQGDERLQRGGQQRGASGAAQDHAGFLAGSDFARLEILRVQQNGRERAPAQRACTGSVGGTAGLGWGEGWAENEFHERTGSAAAVANIGDSQVICCPDGKWRPLPPPRVRWLGNGIPARVAKLRALGNAIVPQVAAEFVRAALA
jgi:DNA (cytosine-5)-methyltransferase 1